MSASRQGMSSKEMKHVVVHEDATIEKNVSNKRKWGSNHGRDSDQQQSKRIEVVRAYATGAGNKKAYARSLPYCNKCKWQHIGPCTVKCGNCERVSHTTKNCRTFAPPKIKKASVANQKPAVTCFGCGSQFHSKSKCLRLKNQMYDYKKRRREKSARTLRIMLTPRQSLSAATIERLITQRVAEMLAAYEANQNNKNRDGKPNVNAERVVPITRECTYQDFLKCQPINFKGTEGVVRLTRWIEKMETVFHIINCP
nr:hypothetical protein [Tanacetum cinerariifolium]